MVIEFPLLRFNPPLTSRLYAGVALPIPTLVPTIILLPDE
jgi:hypothetical protein